MSENEQPELKVALRRRIGRTGVLLAGFAGVFGVASLLFLLALVLNPGSALSAIGAGVATSLGLGLAGWGLLKLMRILPTSAAWLRDQEQREALISTVRARMEAIDRRRFTEMARDGGWKRVHLEWGELGIGPLCKVTAEVDGFTLTVDWLVQGFSEEGWQLRVPGGVDELPLGQHTVTIAGEALPLNLKIGDRDPMKWSITTAMWGSDYRVGDEAFDDRVRVYGVGLHHADVGAWLDESTRALFRELSAKGVLYRNGALWLQRAVPPAEIPEIIALMRRGANRLREFAAPREGLLLENIRGDSDPEVRAYNLAMLALYHADSQQLNEAVGTLLGQAIPPELSDAEEEKLLARLSGESAPSLVGLDGQVAAVIALGRGDSGAAVTALREWAKNQNEFDFLERLAHQSVAAIQARVGPVDGGTLSLTEGTAGALSEAEGQGGELSVAEAEERRKRIAAAKDTTGI